MTYTFSSELREVLQKLMRGETARQILEKAEIYTASGRERNVIKTIRYALHEGKGYTYWGAREDIKNFFEALRKDFLNRDVYPIVMLYSSGERLKGYVAAGIVTNVEYARYDIFWPDEKESGSTIYPYRLKMFIIWLHDSILDNPHDERSWKGIVEPLPLPTPAGLQPRRDKEAKQRYLHFLAEVVPRTLPRILGEVASERYYQPETRLSTTWRSLLDVARKYFTISQADVATLREIELYLRHSRRRAILLIGPPGSGKTLLARVIAEALGYKLFTVTCHQYMTRADLIGDFMLTGTKLTYVPGVLIRALAELARDSSIRGIVILLDEINRVDFDKIAGELLTILGSPEWEVPESLISQLEQASAICEDARLVLEVLKHCSYRLPENIIIIATMNSFDTAALFRLGFAVLRRFRIIRLRWSKDTLLELTNKLIEDSLPDAVKELLNKARDLLEALLEHEECIEVLQPGVLKSFVDYIRAVGEILQDEPQLRTKILERAFMSTIASQLIASSESCIDHVRRVLQQFELREAARELERAWELRAIA